MIGATMVSLSKAKYKMAYVPIPIMRENAINGLINCFSGNRNLKKGKKTRKTSPTLNAVNRSGGIVLMPNFPTG